MNTVWLVAAAWCGWMVGCALAIPPVAVLYAWATSEPETPGVGHE